MLKYRVLYGVILSAAVLFYLFFDGYLSFITLLLIALLPLVSLLCTFLAWICLHLQMEASLPVAAKGSPAQFIIRLQNTSIFPIAHAVLIVHCRNSLCEQEKTAEIHLPINASNSVEIKREIVSQYCGKLTVQLSRVRIFDYFGIFALSQKVNLQTDIYVMPLTIQIDTEIDSRTNYNVDSNIYSKVKSGDDSSEIFQIRDYHEGDRLRSIHWKLSFRLNRLMIKEFSLPLDNSIVILFDLLSASLDLIDTQIEAVVSISQFLLNNQMCHTVEWYDGKTAKFDETVLEQDDDLAALLNRVLAASTYSDHAYTLACHNTLNANREYSHAIYITAKLCEEELMEFCGSEKLHKITILFLTADDLSAEEQALENSLNSMNITVLPVKPEKLRDSIDNLII